MSYYDKYIKYKSKYLALKNQQAGGKSKCSKGAICSGEQLMEFMGKMKMANVPAAIKLFPKKFNKIGSFNVKDKVVIGDTDYTVIPGLKPGLYNAYAVDDNLVISKKPLAKSNFKNMVFSISGKSVGVDSGTFGFYDSKIVNKNNDINIKDFSGEIVKDKGESYGVVRETGIGDGTFVCYTWGNATAMLMGGLTKCNKNGRCEV